MLEEATFFLHGGGFVPTLSFSRTVGGGVLSARLLLHVENPIGKKEEENKSIENRRSVVLYNHIHLAGKIGGSSEHFFGC